jgi:HEPN domain-containing protein
MWCSCANRPVEKLSKGLYVLYIGDNVPRTHNIRILIERFESHLPEPVTEQHYDFFDSLTVHYLNGRYADYQQGLSERLDEQAATRIYRQTQEVFAWLLTLEP